MNKFKVALVVILAAFAAGGAYASPVVVHKAVDPVEFDITGKWSGFVDYSGVDMEIVFKIARNGNFLSATMDIPAQGGKDIRASQVLFEDGRLTIHISSLAFEYTGFLNADGEFKGNMFQNGYNLILDLKRIIDTPETLVRSEEDDGNYVTLDVQYRNREDRNTLGATIVLPEDYNPDTPVVVLVSGSGQQNRDGEVFGHETLRVMADYLARSGIGSLRYDDRGVGQSDTVGLNRANVYHFMLDALAGVRFLKEEKGFRHIGIIGHSEGGLISYMAASRSDDLDFVVSLAGPAMRGDSVLIYQNKALMKASGVSRKERNRYCELLKEIFELKATNDPDNILARIDAYTLELEKEYSDLIQQLRSNIRPLLQPSSWLDHYLQYSPSEDLKTLKCPLLAIQGKRDLQVVARKNVKALRIYTYGNREVKIRQYPGLNHLLQHCETGVPMEYYNIEETISEEVLRDIVSWIKSR